MPTQRLAGEAARAGEAIARALARARAPMAPRERCIVWGGETTVTLDRARRRRPSGGGRCQELALAAARVSHDAGDAALGITLLAAGTDGRDGATDAAGAIVDRHDVGAIAAAGRDPDARARHARVARRASRGERADPAARDRDERERRGDRAGCEPVPTASRPFHHAGIYLFRCMTTAPFTVGIIQDAASDDAEATVAATIERVREAAARGAQIICLKELFNAPYFCKSQKCERFDLAEPIPGPDDRPDAGAGEGARGRAHRADLRAAGARRLSQLGGDHRRRRLAARRVSQDAHPRRSALQREVLLHAGRRATDDRIDGDRPRGQQASGFRVWKTRYAKIGVLICWDQWYPEAARITALLGADILFYPTAIGWHPAEKEEFGAAQVDAWRTMQRAHAIANGVFVASPNRVGHEDEPGTDGIEFFGHSFIADPFGRIARRGGHRHGDPHRASAIRS